MKRKHKNALPPPEYKLVRIPLPKQMAALLRSIMKAFFLVLLLCLGIGWVFGWGFSLLILIVFFLIAAAFVANTISNYRCAPLHIQVDKEKMTITYQEKAFTVFFHQITAVNRNYRATTRGVTWYDRYTIMANGEKLNLVFSGMENELRLRNSFHQLTNQMNRQKLTAVLQEIRTAAQTGELQSYLSLKSSVKWETGSPVVVIGYRKYLLKDIKKFTLSMETYAIRPACIIEPHQGKKRRRPLPDHLVHRQNTIAKIMAVAVANGISVDFHLNASIMIF